MQYRTHEDGPLTTIGIEPGAVVVTMVYDGIGTFTRMHSHKFDHWLTCLSGSARITIDGVSSTVHAGDRYLVAAHKEHAVVPLEIGTVLECRHEDVEIDPWKAEQGIPVEWLDRLVDTKRGQHARG